MDSFYKIYLYEIVEKSKLKLMHSDRIQMNDCLGLRGEWGWGLD